MSLLEWFAKKRRPRVPADVFIEDQVNEALGQSLEGIRAIVRRANHGTCNDREMAILSAFVPLMAMSLSGASEDIQRAYFHSVSERISPEDPLLTQERLHEYVGLFLQDQMAGQASLMPKFLDAALHNVCGTSDESVVTVRAGLLYVISRNISLSRDFFGKLEIRSEGLRGRLG